MLCVSEFISPIFGKWNFLRQTLIILEFINFVLIVIFKYFEKLVCTDMKVYYNLGQNYKISFYFHSSIPQHKH